MAVDVKGPKVRRRRASPVEVDAGPLLRALAEPLRLRIVELLAEEQLCVCHLTEALGVAQPLVSHHLRVLREAGLVETERWRYWTYYRLRSQTLRALADRVGRIAELGVTTTGRRRPCG